MEWAGREREDRVQLPHRAQGREERERETGTSIGGEVEGDAEVVSVARCVASEDEIGNEGGIALPAPEDAQCLKIPSAGKLQPKQTLKIKKVKILQPPLIFSYSSFA